MYSKIFGQGVIGWKSEVKLCIVMLMLNCNIDIGKYVFCQPKLKLPASGPSCHGSQTNGIYTQNFKNI